MLLREARLSIHAAVAYPSWPPAEQPFEQDDFDANFVVLALKRNVERLGKRWMRLRGVRYDVGNLDALADRYHAWAADRIRSFVKDTPVLIPVPNSNAVPSVDDFNGMKIALGIAAKGGGWPVYTGLRFSEVLKPAREGGPRDKETLVSKLVKHGSLPEGTPVLIDDVCSGGGHFFAVQEKLKLPNGTHAFVCGRTVKQHRAPMITNIDEDITTTWFG